MCEQVYLTGSVSNWKDKNKVKEQGGILKVINKEQKTYSTFEQEQQKESGIQWGKEKCHPNKI